MTDRPSPPPDRLEDDLTELLQRRRAGRPGRPRARPRHRREPAAAPPAVAGRPGAPAGRGGHDRARRRRAPSRSSTCPRRWAGRRPAPDPKAFEHDSAARASAASRRSTRSCTWCRWSGSTTTRSTSPRPSASRLDPGPTAHAPRRPGAGGRVSPATVGASDRARPRGAPAGRAPGLRGQRRAAPHRRTWGSPSSTRRHSPRPCPTTTSSRSTTGRWSRARFRPPPASWASDGRFQACARIPRTSTSYSRWRMQATSPATSRTGRGHRGAAGGRAGVRRLRRGYLGTSGPPDRAGRDAGAGAHDAPGPRPVHRHRRRRPSLRPDEVPAHRPRPRRPARADPATDAPQPTGPSPVPPSIVPGQATRVPSESVPPPTPVIDTELACTTPSGAFTAFEGSAAPHVTESETVETFLAGADFTTCPPWLGSRAGRGPSCTAWKTRSAP